jgi:hypothetical protein
MSCNILVKKVTREKLKHLGKMTQTYDDLINELIERRLSPLDRKDWIVEDRERPFEIKNGLTRHRKNEKKKTLVGQRFEPLAQQMSGDHKD